MRRPSFLFFITDQQRADHLGAYGNREVRTPHLDALAARGWVADRCHVASPACMPNRASLMTGRPPSLHGARHNGIPLPLEATTFVERLREAGWRTALIGKSHLQNMFGAPPSWPPAERRLAHEARKPQPGRYDQEWGPSWRDDEAFDMAMPFYGFDTVRLVINHADEAHGHYRRWLEKTHPQVAAVTGPAHAIPAPDYELVAAGQAWRTRVPEECSTTSWVADETIRRLEDHAHGGEPFFIQCSFPDPHHPFTPPGRYWDLHHPDEVTLPASFHAGTPPPHVAWLHAQRDSGRAVKSSAAAFACTEREAREAIALNYGSIAHIDDAIGRVLAALERLGLAQDTVIVFTSDHGDYLGDHQLLLKTPVHYQSLIRTPLIWADPAGPSGARSDALLSTMDFAPTILQRAGVPGYNGIVGQVLPCVAGPDALPRRSVLVEDEVQRRLFGFDAPPRLRTLVTSRWRLSVYFGADWGELYDLQEDPSECRNLWDDPAHGATRRDLLFELVQQILAHGETSPYPSALA